VVDNGWTTCGAGAEIVAAVLEQVQGVRSVQVKRMGFAPVTCPPAPTLEEAYYPNGRTIAAGVRDLVTGKNNSWLPQERADLREIEFKGPF
jgi:pyruvate/2-oxoglutarate/acetoin dehydrogenase E1 component